MSNLSYSIIFEISKVKLLKNNDKTTVIEKKEDFIYHCYKHLRQSCQNLISYSYKKVSLLTNDQEQFLD